MTHWILDALDHEEADEAEDQDGHSAAEGGSKCTHHLDFAGRHKRLGADDAEREDERADAHVHQPRSPVLRLAEHAGEDWEVDSQDRKDGHDHHVRAIDGEERQKCTRALWAPSA